MTKYAVSGTSVVTIDDTGSTARNLSAYAVSVDGMGYVKPALDVTGMSDTAERQLADIQRHPEFSIEFIWDDTASSGSWTVCKKIVGFIVTVSILPDGTLGLAGEAYCSGVSMPFRIGDALHFTATFKWDNSVTIT